MFGSVQTTFTVLNKLRSGLQAGAQEHAAGVIHPSSGDSTMKMINNYLSAVFLAATLVSVMGCSTPPQRETVQYLEDSDVTTKVKAAIYNDPLTKDNEINVATFKGVVQLSGYVSSQAVVDRAVDLARRTSGVKGVTNDMHLK
jgi:hyperosmotically inducible protein